MEPPLRQTLLENAAGLVLFWIVLIVWSRLVPFGPDGSARTWGVILTGYPLMALAVFLLRKPKIARVRTFKFILWAFVAMGLLWTIVLIVGLIDGTSGLECWHSTLASGC
jgi:hypothetical protein